MAPSTDMRMLSVLVFPETFKWFHHHQRHSKIKESKHTEFEFIFQICFKEWGEGSMPKSFPLKVNKVKTKYFK